MIEILSIVVLLACIGASFALRHVFGSGNSSRFGYGSSADLDNDGDGGGGDGGD